MTTRRPIRRRLTVQEILGWADRFRADTGRWPTTYSGGIVGAIGEAWRAVDAALRNGLRGLPRGTSLAKLLAEKRGVRNRTNLPQLSEATILEWAKAHHHDAGTWPTRNSGKILGSGGETWSGIDVALKHGVRSLPGGSSLTQLLAKHRGIQVGKDRPLLCEETILSWADAHFRRTGSWPIAKSGPVQEAPGESWQAICQALGKGLRGLPGGSSLSLLLAERRGVRNAWSRPNLSVQQILPWIDAFHDRTGEWPHGKSGPIPEAPGENWNMVNSALIKGSRGLPGGCSLAKLIADERGVRTRANIPRLSPRQILKWADAFHRRTGRWPTRDSGSVAEAPEETWAVIDAALLAGSRGLPGRSSLARLLQKRRGKRHMRELPPLSVKKIVAWADSHKNKTGAWPNVKSGAVLDAPEERWDLIDHDLRNGHRGLPGGSSLVQLLARKRGVRNLKNLPKLTEEQVLEWAVLHFQRTGRWPKHDDADVLDAPGERWAAIESALRNGKRGFPGGSSLARLLAKVR